MAEEEYVQVLLPEVFVYKIPPKASAAGHKASEWKEQVWVGKLKVVTRDGNVAVKLEGGDGKIFAVAPVRKDGPSPIEKVSDSSRYFVLRIENDKGAFAFIGVGFNNRSDAFDFNVGLQDALKDTDAGKASALDLGPTEDFSLKAGEKIVLKVNIGGKAAGSGGGVAVATGSGSGKIAPPGGIKLRAPGSVAPAPAPAPAAAAAATSGGASGGGHDDLLGLGGAFGAMAVSKPSPAPSPAPASGGWESF